jgi:predicted nucleotidyltransferase
MSGEMSSEREELAFDEGLRSGSGLEDIDQARETMRWIESQLMCRLALKRRWKIYKRGPVSMMRRIYRHLGYVLAGQRYYGTKVERNLGRLGVDEFGRDVELGLRLYARMLIERGLAVHSVIVVGSRVKRMFAPSSDVDAILVLDSLPSLLDKWKITDAPLFLSIEAEPVTREAMRAKLRNFSLTALDAYYWGYVVLDDGFWEEEKRIFERLEVRCRLPSSHLKNMLASV